MPRGLRQQLPLQISELSELEMSGRAEGLLLYRPAAAAAATTVGARQVVGRRWPGCRALRCRNAVQVGWGQVRLIGCLRLTSNEQARGQRAAAAVWHRQLLHACRLLYTLPGGAPGQTRIGRDSASPSLFPGWPCGADLNTSWAGYGPQPLSLTCLI